MSFALMFPFALPRDPDPQADDLRESLLPDLSNGLHGG